MNEQNSWALDDVSMNDSTTSTDLIQNGGFETGNWPPWTYWLANNSAYYSSGMSKTSDGWYHPHTRTYFYVDVQYTTGDGIFQNVTTVVGTNYTVSFYLASPRGGNVSVAVVSIG